MNRTRNRFLLFVLSFFLINVAFSQTLYWIGGSGDFNDPKHWSKSSGGKPAFQIPDIKTDVVFDDLSAKGYYSVIFGYNNSVKSLSAISIKNILKFSGNKTGVVYVSEGFYLSPLVKFESEAEMIFNSNSPKINLIEFGLNKLNCNLYFNSGTYEFRPIALQNQKTINFKDGSYNFNNSFVEAGNFKNASSDAKFYFNDATILVKNDFNISPDATFISDNLYISANKNSIGELSAPASLTSQKTNTIVNNIMAPCTVTITTSPACTGPCTGVLKVFFDVANCLNPPYTVTVTNGTCPAQAIALSAVNVTASVYSNTTACACAALNYLVRVRDASNTLVGSAFVNFIPNPIINNVTVTDPTCSYLCNGIFDGNILVGSAFTVAVVPATATPVFTTTSSYTLSNLCAGNYTFTITDIDGCVATDTQTLTAPSPISPNPVTTSLTCFGSNNGTFKVSPTGGVAGYTVHFNTGPTFTIPAAGTASINSLPVGVYTATITDVNGCTVTANSNVTGPSSITVVQTQTNLTCFSICNGAASVSVGGGTPPYVYVWTPGPSATNSITALCSGTQVVTILDNNGCASIKNFTITSPPAITVTVNQKNITCNAACNGAATVQAVGGTGAMTYTWTGPAFGPVTTSVISALCPGVYTVAVKDAVNCPATQTINLTQPPALTITSNVINNTCFSFCAGSATAVIAGGNGAPYSFTWTPATTSAVAGATTTASNLCQGTYTVSAKDASACPVSATISITQPSSITPNAITTSVTCNGACNGSITVAPVGGSGGPYTVSLVTPAAATLTAVAPPTASFTALCAGVYTLSVKDVSNCVSTTTINVQQPNPLAPSIASVNVTCFNACNGSLAGSVLGGTPGYTLMWNTPTGTVAGGNIVGQCAGNYTFNVTDSHQCTVALTCTLTQPADITTNSVITNPTCNGGCNGAISTTVAGGTPGYTLNWSNAGPNPNINLCAGVYTLLVVDANGCNKTFTASVVSPPAITISIVTASTNCSGSCDGSATVTAIGGTGLLTYQFNTIPVTTNTTGIISGLCAGGYIVSVTDANGCNLPQAFNIGSPPLLTAAITGILPTCNVCTGAATVTPAGGTPGYTVNWTNAASATVAVGNTAANLCLGSYTANVIDSKGCTVTAVANIPNTVSVTVVTGGSSILCFGACNASATANALGGTPPYTYTWTTIPVQNTQSAVNLCAGSYTVTVKDQLGCSNTGTINFTQPSSVTVNSSQTNIPCFAGCNGKITTTVSGGTPAYTYSWSPGGQTTTSLTNLCAGNYSLLVKDLNNCSQNFTFNITQNPSITAVFTATNPSGCVVNNGTIVAVASGGSGAGYTFTWTPPSTSVVAGGTTTATGLGAGNYSLMIKDGAGCTATLSTNLSSPTGPTVNVTSASVTCFAANNGSATATAIGTGPFSFTWSPATASLVAAASTTATNLGAGIYNINVKDGNGCITSQTVNIATPSAATITSNVFPALCNAACNGSITTTVAGGTPPFVSYSWLPVAPPITGQGTGTVSNLCAGNFTLNLTDNNGCVTTKTFVITQPSSLTVTSTQTNVTCNTFSNGAISLTVTGGSPAYTYSWSPVGTFTGSSNSSVLNLAPNVYTVVVKDLNNCPVTLNFTITQPAALGHTINTTNLTCNAACIGTASQVVTGGTPTYSFSWSSTAATTQSINALCAGNYTGTVIDGNGCISSLPFTITQPAAISITLTPTHPKCNAQCNGSITSNVVGGNGGYSYSWLPVGAGPNPTGLCPGNYTLSVTDASLCPGSAVVTLTNPPSVNANVSFTNPLCSAGCNGIAVSNPLNATAPISYTWTNVPASFTNVASNLCAGAYTVFISDFNGCTAVGQVTLSSPPSLTITPSTLPATCGNANGTINITVSGGTPTYAILWTPTAATTTFVNNVLAGIYTVAVTDANGCTNTVSIPLSNSNGPNSATITQTNVKCNGQCTGGATVTAAAGSTALPYSFSWVSPPSASTVNPQSNLCAGNYTAQVKDANNCLYFQSITITQNPAIDDNEIVTNAICNGICTGSVVLTPTGGVGPYNYSWNTIPVQSASTATGLCVGIQTVTITDFLLCPATFTYAINGQTVVTAAVASTSNNCFGNCIATSSATGGGGLAPYTYAWSNAQTGPLANNLCNGTYSVLVTDKNGCKNTFTTQVISPSSITIVPSISSPSCGLCNGSSTVVVGGGTPTYTYTWSSGGTTTAESNLCAGLYQVLITDANGCTQVQNIPISNSSGITGETFTVQNETCFNNCNGSASVAPVGGNPPVTFNWINPASTNSFVTNLCGGTYFVQMTDAQGCIRTSSVSVSSATNINIVPTVITPSCNTNNGTITVNVSGGTGTYTLNWLPAGAGTVLANVGAGIYTLTVFDGICTKTTAVIVNNTTAPVLFSVKVDNGCAGMPCIGSVVITPTLGTPGYSTLWSNGNVTNTVSSLCQGVITVTVTDAANCKAVQSFTIDQNPAINLSLPNVVQVKCNNDCTGSINIIPNGGTIPYVYTWNPTTAVIPANPLTNLCTGTYTSIVTDAKGCSVTSTINLVNPAPFSLTALVTDATCNTSADGSVTANVSGATPAYTYSWSGPATFTTPTISNLVPGTYSLSITDANGCKKDTSMVIGSTFTVLAKAGKDTTFCTNNFILLDGSNSINAASYTWSLAPANATVANTATTLVNPAIGSNTYVLFVTSSVAACFDDDTVVVNVNALPDINAGPTMSMALYSNTVIGGSPVTTSSLSVTYTWSPSATLNNPNIPNPTASNTVNTTYTLTITDANGCVSTSTVDVLIYPEIKIPNGFSPNADGRNDAWVIDNIQQFTQCKVQVYNRWGELLFESPPGYPVPFDGRYNNKELPVGTYYYVIDLKHVAYPNAYTGPLTIFR